MTTILAVKKKNKVCIGADTQVTTGSMKMQSTVSKLIKFRYGKNKLAVIAFAGSAAFYIPLKIYLSNKDNLPEEFTLETLWQLFNNFLNYLVDNSFVKGTYDDANFTSLPRMVLATKSDIFVIGCERDISQHDDFYAVGSGEDFAFGAVHALYKTNASAKAVVAGALEASNNFDLYSSGKLDIIEL